MKCSKIVLSHLESIPNRIIPPFRSTKKKKKTSLHFLENIRIRERDVRSDVNHAKSKHIHAMQIVDTEKHQTGNFASSKTKIIKFQFSLCYTNFILQHKILHIFFSKSDLEKFLIHNVNN